MHIPRLFSYTGHGCAVVVAVSCVVAETTNEEQQWWKVRAGIYFLGPTGGETVSNGLRSLLVVETCLMTVNREVSVGASMFQIKTAAFSKVWTAGVDVAKVLGVAVA